MKILLLCLAIYGFLGILIFALIACCLLFEKEKSKMKWWQVLRALAFGLFLGPSCIVYILFAENI